MDQMNRKSKTRVTVDLDDLNALLMFREGTEKYEPAKTRIEEAIEAQTNHRETTLDMQEQINETIMNTILGVIHDFEEDYKIPIPKNYVIEQVIGWVNQEMVDRPFTERSIVKIKDQTLRRIRWVLE